MTSDVQSRLYSVTFFCRDVGLIAHGDSRHLSKLDLNQFLSVLLLLVVWIGVHWVGCWNGWQLEGRWVKIRKLRNY